MSANKQFINETICPICGKIFYPSKDWVYIVKVNHRNKKVCSYTCTKGKKEKKYYDKIWEEYLNNDKN